MSALNQVAILPQFTEYPPEFFVTQKIRAYQFQTIRSTSASLRASQLEGIFFPPLLKRSRSTLISKYYRVTRRPGADRRATHQRGAYFSVQKTTEHSNTSPAHLIHVLWRYVTVFCLLALPTPVNSAFSFSFYRVPGQRLAS